MYYFPRETCKEQIERIEVYKGELFICSFNECDPQHLIDLSRLNPETSQREQCGRSYMSQRDLTAHVKHRHESN
jgi:hypothetical protein